MKVKTSNHYILLYDTDDDRADDRLKLLEAVYESFLGRFFAQGVTLEIPRERLKVVLFQEHKDFLFFSLKRDPMAIYANGFWDPATNASVFYDQATSELHLAFKEVSERLQQRKREAIRRRGPQTKEIVRLADTIALLVELARENEDVKVVSHEATHQLAGNTGLLPRHVLVPKWVHEGLAAYFETPEDAAWSGVGAVNPSRLRWYRDLERDREHSNLEFVVSDKIFTLAVTNEGKLHGYGQGWALTHFLMERHFVEFMTFYRRLGEMPPHTLLGPEVLLAAFDEAFDGNRAGVEAEWRLYMRSLKTDLEQILDEK